MKPVVIKDADEIGVRFHCEILIPEDTNIVSVIHTINFFEQFLVNHPKNGLQNIEQEILYTIQKSADRLLIKDLIIVE